MSGSHLSKDFFDLVKAIGESKSKQQEDSIIVEEVANLKKRMIEANVSKKKMKEFLIRLVYVEMLGHDASFGYIKAIELAASKNLVQKRVGYLCSGLCLSPSHEFRFMLVNQLQQDMASANFLEVAGALTACMRLATCDMIPALVDRVLKLAGHAKELVRKKVAMVLHRFYQLDPNAVAHLGEAMRRTLCDKDPSVMAAALCLLHDMIQAKPAEFKELVPSFVSILKQIIEHRLPRDFDYHRIPAPWAQLRLLRILANLGRADQRCSEGCYEVLSDAMRRADTGINVGYAIIYECIRTVTTIYPNATLLDEAAKSIARFLASENNNLKYLGITGLAQLVESHPKYAAEHQLAVIECLEDGDETLKRKTLDLLYRMINPVNVEFIADKLIHSLETSTDEFLRKALVSRLCTAAERFAPSNEWYVATVLRVLELAGNLVQPEVTQTLISLVAEGGEDDDDDALRVSAVDRCAAMLDWEAIPDALLHILAWVLGEYGALASELDICSLGQALIELCNDDARLRGSVKSRALLITACTKTAGRILERSDIDTTLQTDFKTDAKALASKFATSANLDLQQRCIELLGVFDVLEDGPNTSEEFFAQVLPYDASLEDALTSDGNDALSFLDKFVASALQAGAAPYAPPNDEEDEINTEFGTTGGGASLKYEAYEKPTFPVYPNPAAVQPPNMGGTPPPVTAPNVSGNTPGLPPGRSGGNAIGAGRLSGGLAAASGPWGAKPQLQQQAPPPPDYNTAYSTPHRTTDIEQDTPPTRELTEKERMAAALFGGVGDSKTKTTSIGGRKSNQTGSARRPKPEVSPSSAPAPSPIPPPVPAPEISLLDLGDDEITAPTTNTSASVFDNFAIPATLPPVAPPAPAPQAVLDPFAAISSSTPNILAPAKLSTADFGTRWTSSRHDRKALVNAPFALDVLASKLALCGLHPVEAIPTTQEVILAATHLASGVLCLCHAKLHLNKVNLIVKASDASILQSVLDSIVSSLESS